MKNFLKMERKKNLIHLHILLKIHQWYNLSFDMKLSFCEKWYIYVIKLPSNSQFISDILKYYEEDSFHLHLISTKGQLNFCGNTLNRLQSPYLWWWALQNIYLFLYNDLYSIICVGFMSAHLDICFYQLSETHMVSFAHC